MNAADRLHEVLAEVEGWEPQTVAVGVTDARRTSATHGPTGKVLAFASVTKPLAAYATLIAVQDGLLNLDEPVEVPEATTPVTVRQLLAHASGLPVDRGGHAGTPERRRIYSNLGFEVLEALVAQRAGRAFAEHLELEVLAPLGMRSTALDGPASRGANGTVTDLLSFARELLHPTLLDAELLATATRPAYPTLDGVLPGFGRQSPNLWGLGFEVRGRKSPHWTGRDQDPATFGHFGRSGSFLWVDPTAGIAAALLADLEFGAWAVSSWPGFNDRIMAAATEATSVGEHPRADGDTSGTTSATR